MIIQPFQSQTVLCSFYLLTKRLLSMVSFSSARVWVFVRARVWVFVRAHAWVGVFIHTIAHTGTPTKSFHIIFIFLLYYDLHMLTT